MEIGNENLPQLDDIHIDLEPYSDDWFFALRLLVQKVLAKKLGVSESEVAPIDPWAHETCNDDEAIHFRTPLGLVHVCYTDADDISMEWEVECPICGEPMPLSSLGAHLEVDHSGG